MTLAEMPDTLGVSRSALQRWIAQSKYHQLETVSDDSQLPMQTMTTKEKSPQDWTLEESFSLIVKSDGLNDKKISDCYRSEGFSRIMFGNSHPFQST